MRVMILTDRFVVLNFPRTGSTYVRTVLRELHQRHQDPSCQVDPAPHGSHGFRELILPIDRTGTAERFGRQSQHGRWGQIPESHRHLPVVSVVRHPLDHAVSTFLHDQWRREPPSDESTLRRRFPAWPALSFGEFLQFQHEFALPDVLKGLRPSTELGWTTVHFLRFYGRDAEALIMGATDADIDSGRLSRELPPIHWLRNHRLTEDLAEFLRDMGYTTGQVNWVRRHRRENVTESRAGRAWPLFFSPEQERLKRHRERLLFRLFPDLGE